MTNGTDSPGRGLVLVGTYTTRHPWAGPVGRLLAPIRDLGLVRGPGIHVLDLDPRTGRLEPAGASPPVRDPSFLAAHPSGRFVYAVHERARGRLTAFALDRETPALRPLDRRPTRGAAPCHAEVDPTGRWIGVANYRSGSVATLPIAEDGTLGEPACVVRHRGSSVAARQRRAHPHAFHFASGGELVLVPDLGMDRLVPYRFDPADGSLSAREGAPLALPPGQGPRQLALSRDGAAAYLINELGSTLTVLRVGTDEPARAIQTVSTLPADWRGPTTAAEAHVHPGGRFLYASNRGHDSLAVFAIAPDGTLAPIGHVPTGGREPRSFAIDPSGSFLIAANQYSGRLVVFAIDADDGALTRVGEARVPRCACVRFV